MDSPEREERRRKRKRRYEVIIIKDSSTETDLLCENCLPFRQEVARKTSKISAVTAFIRSRYPNIAEEMRAKHILDWTDDYLDDATEKRRVQPERSARNAVDYNVLDQGKSAEKVVDKPRTATASATAVRAKDPELITISDDEDQDYPDKQTFCLCNRVAYGEMIKCEDPECRVQWYHYDCVGLTSGRKPRGCKWICRSCKEERKWRK